MTDENLAAAKTVMVVDDDETVRSFLAFSLKSEGFTVLEAAEPAAALKIIESETPHLFLLDIMMPVMDGFALCAKIRAMPRFDKSPILFITAYADKQSLSKTAAAGAQGLIEKPIMFDELLMQVLDALSGRFSLPTRLKFSAD